MHGVELDDVTARLRAIVAKLWGPDIATVVNPLYTVHSERHRGDISTDVPIELSRHLALGADEIAQKIASCGSLVSDLEMRADRGFLNLTLRYPSRRCASPALPAEQHRRRIVVLNRPSWLEPFGYLRMSASAFVQAQLLGVGPTEIWIAGHEIRADESADPLSLWRAIIARVLDGSGESVPWEQSISSAHEITVWCAPESLSTTEFRALCSRIKGPRGRVESLKTPERLWLQTVELPRKVTRAIERMDEDQLFNLAVYLASPLLGSDLDLAVPLHVERMNLRAWLANSLERLHRTIARAGAGISEQVDSGTSPEGSLTDDLRYLWAHGELLRAQIHQGFTRGDISELWSSLDQLLVMINREVDNHALRGTRKLGPGVPHQVQILSGVARRLSDSMKEKLFCLSK